MIIQEPIKATISFALENYAYSDAIFLSERLHAEVSTDESLFLLATSYYRSGKPNVAYLLLSAKHSKFCKSPQCLFLLSRCCFELKKYPEAMDTLTGPFFSGDIAPNKEKILSRDELTQFYGELASFVAQLLGSIAVKLDFAEMAAHYYTVSLKINPFLWSSFEKLVQLEPSDVECTKLLTLDNFEFKYSCGTNPLISLLNSSSMSISPPPSSVTPSANALSNQNSAANCLFDNTNTSHIQTPPISQQQQQLLSSGLRAKIEISTPYAVIKQSSNETNKLDVITPETNGCWRTLGCVAPAKNQNQAPVKVGRKVSSFALKSLCNIESTNQPLSNSNKTSGANNQPITNVSKNLLNLMESPVVSTNRHTFGTLQLDEDSLSIDELPSDKDSLANLGNNNSNPTGNNNNSNNNNNNNKTTQRNTIGMALHDSSSPAPVKKPYTRTRNNQQDLQEVSANINSPTTGVLRRSSRLYSGSNWVKENASSPKTAKITRTPTKRSRRTISFEKSADQKELNDLNKPNANSMLNTKGQAFIDLTKAGIKVQRSSAFGLIELMTKFGSAYKLLSQFKCKEAVEEFKRLSSNHLNTGYVLTSIGRAYFEMGKYDDAIFYFRKCHQLEPYRLQGKEIYSTALWHQQKEVDLSCLAQEMIEFDKNAPETWCVAGNCFSLQKEHEISIKFLKRAIQVDSDFSYAYTLLGHELVSADELDNAMACFRNATRLDRRHYNAWYGIGMIYYKQEKYQYAYLNYKRALDISASNPVLMCHLAIVAHHLKKSSNAISLLEEASKLDPNNALVKFHLASIYFNNEKYQLALEELEQLKQIVPKESMVYFLIGKIHKIRGDTHLALMNFSWAMDLDPKGASNQIKELIDRQYGNEEEMVIHSTNSNVIGGGGGGGSSTANTTSGAASNATNHSTVGSSVGSGNVSSSDSSNSTASSFIVINNLGPGGSSTSATTGATTGSSQSGSSHHHHHSHSSSIITTTITAHQHHHHLANQNPSTTTPFQQRSSLSSTTTTSSAAPAGTPTGTLTGSNGSSNSNNISNNNNNNDSNIRRNSGGSGSTISSRRNNNATNIINNTPNPNSIHHYIISDVFDIRMGQDEIEEDDDEVDDDEVDDDDEDEVDEEEIEDEDVVVNRVGAASSAGADAGTSILTPGLNTGTGVTARLRTINLTPLTLTPPAQPQTPLNDSMASFGDDDDDDDDEDLLEEDEDDLVTANEDGQLPEEEEEEEVDEDSVMQF